MLNDWIIELAHHSTVSNLQYLPEFNLHMYPISARIILYKYLIHLP